MSIYDTLNPEQVRAVQHKNGPLLILAGAGSGKTRVLTHRIAYLMDEHGVSPWNILALTFTNKAAKEMRERVDNLIGYGSQNIWVSTFHSTCVRILRRYIEYLGYGKNFTIYDSDDQKSLIRDLLKYLQIDTKKFKERSFLNAISAAKDELISPDEFERQAGQDLVRKKYAAVYREYQKRLYKNNALDFDDLIYKTVELFQNFPEPLAYYQQRFQYIMVDEYQDTNTAQFHLIRTLASAIGETGEAEHNLCVVGDDDQSIYKFRGANIYNILNFEKEYPNAKVIKLEQNYRSTQNILTAANEVICHNTQRKPKALWTDKEDGDPIYFTQFETEYEEAQSIAADISNAVSQDGSIEYNNFAILYRTNAQSRILEEKLLQSNIPYKIIGAINFYQRKEIKDMLAYLRTVDNGQDDISVKRIINIPRRGIGLTTMDRVADYAIHQELSFYQALKHASLIPGLGRGVPKISSFVSFIEILKSNLRKPDYTIHDLLDEITEATGYIRELEADGSEEALGRMENIDELRNKIIAYEKNCEGVPSLSEFLEEVALVADIDNLDENQNRVVLMTLHSAKGLEFPYVYLCGLEDGIFPSRMTIISDDPSDLEEERRLCYVGITRAMKKLSISAARQRMQHGETQFNKPSCFIREIPRYLIKENAGSLSPRFPREGSYKDNVIRHTFGRESQSAILPSSYTGSGKTAASGNNPFVGNPYIQKGIGSLSSHGPLASPPDYQTGDRVEHVKFGIGIVTDLKKGPRDYEVVVDFGERGIKKMQAGFAKLKKASL